MENFSNGLNNNASNITSSSSSFVMVSSGGPGGGIGGSSVNANGLVVGSSGVGVNNTKSGSGAVDDDDDSTLRLLTSGGLVDYSECASLDEVDSLGQFVKCFQHFVSKSTLTSCLVLSFACATVVLNTAVIMFIHRLKNHKTVFDRIFIGHCVVDALVGLLVIPNYCIYIVFGYWPLGKLLCHFYVSLDYTICHVGILHMVFVAYARLRSLQAPKKYHNEWIISHAKLTMLVLWVISSLMWLPAVNLILYLSFKNRECYFTYHPAYIIIQDSVAYLLPMFVILGITGYILQTLRVRNKRRNQLKRKKKLRLPKLIAQERQKSMAAAKNPPLTTATATTTTVILKITENFSTSDASEYNSETAAVVMNAATSTNAIQQQQQQQQQSTLSPNQQQADIESSNTMTSTTPSPNAMRLKATKIRDDDVSSSKLSSSCMMQQHHHALIARKEFRIRSALSKQVSNATSLYESSYTGLNSIDDESSSVLDKQGNLKSKSSLRRRVCKTKRCFRMPKLNAYAKLYVIIATFCILWLPFCVLWPINAVCDTCISPFVYQLSYWMGYAQSLINPILLLILNPNYNKLKSDA